jgi:DNA-binding PadR family transcriptional regulator
VSAKHALLGLLLHRPAYRYQLGDRLQKLLGPAWRINPGQLYRTIKRLEGDGLIERIDDAEDDRDERNVFAITDDGIVEFEHWFENSKNEARLLRRPLLVKIMLAGPQRLESALGHIIAYEQACAACVKELTLEQEEIPAGGQRVLADDELRRFALSGEINSVDAELKWARYMHERVSWLKSQDVIWPSTYEHQDPAGRARDRQGAREELFGRIAGGERPPHGEPAQHRDDGSASAPSKTTRPGATRQVR